jgi:hypothetical protein
MNGEVRRLPVKGSDGSIDLICTLDVGVGPRYVKRWGRTLKGGPNLLTT